MMKRWALPILLFSTRMGYADEVHFSPHGGCQQAIVAFIHSAKRSVHVQAYGFTSRPIAAALVERRQAGVQVEVVLDKSNLPPHRSELPTMLGARIPTWIDEKHAIAHNKVIVVDGARVEVGSYNYTSAAETSNAENCMFLDSPSMAARYEENWQEHRAHSIHPEGLQ